VAASVTATIAKLRVPAVAAESRAPSLTTSVTKKSPVAVQVCDGVTPVPLVPSPKSHAYVRGAPSESLEAEPSRVMVSPTVAR
jgi:hypothetical protein